LGRLELVDLRDAIVATFRGCFNPASVPTVEVFRGKWNAETVREYSRRMPAVVVYYLGSKSAERTGLGKVRVPMVIGCTVMARIGDGTADDANAAMATVLFSKIPNNTWGVECDVQGAEDLQFENGYTTKVDGTGINIWSMAWVQTVDIPPLTEAALARLDDFIRVHATYDIAAGDTGHPISEQQFEVQSP
jgi:phage gp37-like protein